MIYNIVVDVLMTLIRVLKRPGYTDPGDISFNVHYIVVFLVSFNLNKDKRK